MTGRITLLGLGRMGTAMAHRLRDQGFTVGGWHRSGKPVEGVTVEPDPLAAVATAGTVIVSLFDDDACAEVLDRIRPGLPTGVPVVNTSTTGTAAAERFAEALGSAYVHAPVIGSVPAVSSGTLLILASGRPAAVEQVAPVLQALGSTIQVGHAGTAAAIKLIANGVLAGTVATLRDALRHADALGLDRSLVLDVLGRGPAGRIIGAKRDRLLDPTMDRGADFSVAAFAKDQALLAAASPHPWPVARDTEAVVASGAVGPDDDVAALVTAPADQDEVMAPLRAYIRGHATGDPGHFLDAFLPSARIEGLRDGAIVSWTVSEYVKLFDGRPAPDEARRWRRIDAVSVAETIASATMTLHHGTNTFTDMFILVRTRAGWRIANKVYHRH